MEPPGCTPSADVLSRLLAAFLNLLPRHFRCSAAGLHERLGYIHDGFKRQAVASGNRCRRITNQVRHLWFSIGRLQLLFTWFVSTARNGHPVRRGASYRAELSAAFIAPETQKQLETVLTDKFSKEGSPLAHAC